MQKKSVDISPELQEDAQLTPIEMISMGLRPAAKWDKDSFRSHIT
jgi:hypothetical protein